MKKNSKYLWILGILLLASFSFLNHVQADDYDIYVDADNDGDEDGDEDDPFNTIAEALAEADDGDEIFIEKGEYNEDLTIKKEISLFGDDIEDVVIDGQITIEENTEIEELTIDGNVIVKSGADVVFNNLIIKEASKVAVEAYEGNGEIVIKNSVIKKAGTKGLYIQNGRDIVISGCTVYGNEEEGIDLRNNVDGTVSGNTVYDNGESGIEFIVGDSTLAIKNNTFKNNGSSGIAAQYYKDFDDKGEITISNNTATGNSKYGLGCNTPQGGNPGSDYWKKSISVDKNNFKSNSDGEINDNCGVTQPTQEAQKEEQEKTRQEEIDANEKEKEQQEQQEEANRKATIAENTEELDKLVARKLELKNEIEAEVEKIRDRSGFTTFFIGANYKAINNIEEIAEGFSDYLSEFDDLDRKLIEEENQEIAEEEMEDIVAYVEEVNELINEKYSKFSLFGWLFRIIS